MPVAGARTAADLDAMNNSLGDPATQHGAPPPALELFRRFDTDRDGLLRRGELIAMLAEMGWVHQAEHMADALLTALGAGPGLPAGGVGYADFAQLYAHGSSSGGGAGDDGGSGSGGHDSGGNNGWQVHGHHQTGATGSSSSSSSILQAAEPYQPGHRVQLVSGPGGVYAL